MALPRWTTPAGNLGIVPELEFYELVLEASDASGGNLRYSHVSGRLPLGIQIIESGKIQGVPVSEQGGDQNVEYTFTVRVKNEIDFVGSINGTILTVTTVGTGELEIGQTLERTGLLPNTKIISFLSGSGGVGTYKINQSQSLNSSNFIATSGISDRTFRLTVTNVAPPIINSPEKNSFLGLYLDGGEVEIVIEAIEFTPGIELKWELINGTLPEGLSFSDQGVISGFIYPIISTEPGTTPGWDASVWSQRGWDFPLVAVSKTFTFTVQVSDGIKYDQSTYTLLVFPRAALTADNDLITVDLERIGTDFRLTIDAGTKHRPIITTTQADFIPARQGSFYSFNLEAVDVDNDVVWWTFASASSGGFDEQDIIGVGRNYIASKLTTGKLTKGLFPKSLVTVDAATDTSITVLDYTNVNLLPNNEVKVLNSSNLFEVGTVNNTTTILISGNTIPNINVNDFITQSSSGANATVTAVGNTTGNITLFGNTILGNITIGVPSYQLITNANIVANVGSFITQATSGANARVSGRPGYLVLSSDAQLANIRTGDTITQVSTGANAYVLLTPNFFNTDNVFYVNFTTIAAFTMASGNVTFGHNGNITIANSYPTSSNITANTVNILYNVGQFDVGFGNLRVNGVDTFTVPSAVIKDATQRTFNANIGDILTQTGSSGSAVVVENVLDSVVLPVIYINPGFNDYAGNIIYNGTDANVWVTNLTLTSRPFVTSANVGDYITQTVSSANARVTANVISASVIPVEFLSNNFIAGSGNLKINAANITAYPSRVIAETEISSSYNTGSTWDINFSLTSGQLLVNGNPTFANVTALLEVGVTLTSTVDEGVIGFDEGRFDQGELVLPAGITINQQTGWVTGTLPSQTVNQVEYQFEVIAFKRDDATYRDTQLFTITVLGDINNRIDWLTPSNLGSIQNGKVSDLYVAAEHFTDSTPKTLIYQLKPNARKKLPQGLNLLTTGLIVGRVSFQVFLLDAGTTTIDGGRTTFDETYTFVVEARDLDRTISAERTFTIRVLSVNIEPYENLYLKALPTREQRNVFSDIVQNGSLFPSELIYRKEDPWFGVANNLRMLFLPGLLPSTMADYTAAAEINHFTKKLQFGQIKTARALDTDFNVKYEVVYLDITDSNTNEFGFGPQNIIDLTSEIDNPYLDLQGEDYYTAYPNSFSNMQSRMASEITYANKGALPDWMTSRQTNGRILGFTRAVVLAYCVPGGSGVIAYRLRQNGFDFNELDFTVDRYLLDNVYSQYYDNVEDKFITSLETTFDRYPTLPSSFIDAGIIDYAVSDAFEQINNQPLDTIKASPSLGGLGGLDGVRNIKQGDLLVFAEQEFTFDGFDGGYDSGWSLVSTIWDLEGWDADPNPLDAAPGEGWNAASYVPGFIENNLNPSVINQRIGVWQVNIVSDVVQLQFVKAINYFDKLYVRNGRTYGGTNIFYDPTVKPNKSLANYTLILQQIQTTYTTFDGNGTRFYDNRDGYVVPGEGDKYIKFTSTGVFT